MRVRVLSPGRLLRGGLRGLQRHLRLGHLFVHGVVLRNRPSSTGGLCLGIEGGVAIPVLVLHGEAKSGVTYYVGPALGLHMEDTDKVQPVLRLRYMFANWSDALGAGVNPAHQHAGDAVRPNHSSRAGNIVLA